MEKNLFIHIFNKITKCVWQRYTNSQLFLGDYWTAIPDLLAYAFNILWGDLYVKTEQYYVWE